MSFTGVLVVPAAIANEQIRVVVQVVDGAGNVSWASNKGPGFAPTPPPPPPPQVTLSPVVPTSGWFGSAPQITVAGNASTTFDVSIDGGPKVTYLGPFTPTGLADGAHVIEAIGSDGSSAFVTVRVDTTPPAVDVEPVAGCQRRRMAQRHSDGNIRLHRLGLRRRRLSGADLDGHAGGHRRTHHRNCHRSRRADHHSEPHDQGGSDGTNAFPP